MDLIKQNPAIKRRNFGDSLIKRIRWKCPNKSFFSRAYQENEGEEKDKEEEEIQGIVTDISKDLFNFQSRAVILLVSSFFTQTLDYVIWCELRSFRTPLCPIAQGAKRVD
ncbi:hypothetical protein E2C01_096803 [Portunus trituberculatus]|uniref:Uncharacterized protein n=1 Tax=Portunus trituberculatus TaxID=210409 RepID=A0A5B7K3V4_PORTR|nr:hypothetical protein [Portunus trituberculatus]